MTTAQQIWRDIRALPCLSAIEMRDLVQAIRSKLPDACTSAEAEALDDCICLLDDAAQPEINEAEAADWLQERKQCGNRAELDQYTPRTSGSVPAFITEGATA